MTTKLPREIGYVRGLMNKKYNVAVIGATGSVGAETIKILDERNFPVNEIYAIASSSSIGKALSYGEKILKAEVLENIDINKIDIAFFCTSEAVSKKYIPSFKAANCLCIDKSAAYRMDEEVALIVPEINFNSFKTANNKNVIASPNCCVIPIALVLKPLGVKVKIKRAVISTYQSTSGAGKDAMDELYRQTKSKYVFGKLEPSVFPKEIAFNIIPQIGDFDSNGNTLEETKISVELEKILGSQLKSSVTCVRVPVFVGHSMSVNIEFEEKINAKDAINILKKQDFLNVLTQSNSISYLTPAEVSGEDFVHVSRIRNDFSKSNSINLWISCDNLRKGAALNAVQIAEYYIGLTK